MYISIIWYCVSLAPNASIKRAVSCKLNGSSFIRCVTLLYKPPRALIRFFFIQEEAEPQAMSTTLSMSETYWFQKKSNADIKFDLGLSSQGISSIKSTYFCFFFGKAFT